MEEVYPIWTRVRCHCWATVRNMVHCSHQVLDHRAPRVIRTVAAPWRSPDLTWRELKQVSLANCLLQIALICFLDIMIVGCCAIAQHPATIDLHVQRSALSIWRLPHTRSTLRALHSDFITFEQGYLGARARAGLSFPITPLSGGITVAC